MALPNSSNSHCSKLSRVHMNFDPEVNVLAVFLPQQPNLATQQFPTIFGLLVMIKPDKVIAEKNG